MQYSSFISRTVNSRTEKIRMRRVKSAHVVLRYVFVTTKLTSHRISLVIP